MNWFKSLFEKSEDDIFKRRSSDWGPPPLWPLPSKIDWGPRTTSHKVIKDKNQITILMGVPGRSHDDIGLRLAGSILCVKTKDYTGCDIEHNFRVASSTEISDVSATAKNGLLTILIKRNNTRNSTSSEMIIQSRHSTGALGALLAS